MVGIMQKVSRTIRVLAAFLIFGFALPLASCGINVLGGFGSGSGVSSYADSASAVESQLFDDGPVDIPVTIAKMDSPDLSLITVTAESVTSFSQSAFLTAEPSVDVSDYLFTI